MRTMNPLESGKNQSKYHGPDSPKEELQTCDSCHLEIQTGEIYLHRGEKLCEECCMDSRMSYLRKFHWQYIRSIEKEYLRHERTLGSAKIKRS